MNLVIVLAIIICLALVTFLSPVWAEYAIFGLAVGWSLYFIIRKLRKSKTFRVILIVLLFFVGVGYLSWFLAPQDKPEEYRAKILEVSYQAIISHHPSPQPWEIHEELVVSREEAWLDLFGAPQAPRMRSYLEAEMRRGIEANGWTPQGFVESPDRYERSREIRASARWFPATTKVNISTEIAFFPFYAGILRLIPNTDSKIVIRSPRYLVGATFPPHSSRADILHDDLERLTVHLKLSRFEEPEIRLELLSPLLQWGLGPQIASLSLWSGLEWLFLVICCIFSEQIKEKILKPAISPLFRRKAGEETDDISVQEPDVSKSKNNQNDT